MNVAHLGPGVWEHFDLILPTSQKRAWLNGWQIAESISKASPSGWDYTWSAPACLRTQTEMQPELEALLASKWKKIFFRNLSVTCMNFLKIFLSRFYYCVSEWKVFYKLNRTGHAAAGSHRAYPSGHGDTELDRHAKLRPLKLKRVVQRRFALPLKCPCEATKPHKLCFGF